MPLNFVDLNTLRKTRLQHGQTNLFQTINKPKPIAIAMFNTWHQKAIVLDLDLLSCIHHNNNTVSLTA